MKQENHMNTEPKAALKIAEAVLYTLGIIYYGIAILHHLMC